MNRLKISTLKIISGAGLAVSLILLGIMSFSFYFIV
jgi:hypothetical protein